MEIHGQEPSNSSQNKSDLSLKGVEKAQWTKLPFGEDLQVYFKGVLPTSSINFKISESSLIIPEGLKEKLLENQAAIKANPNRWDGEKWRTEGINFVEHNGSKEIEINISPILYSEHDLLKKERFASLSQYPNPITVNAAQETKDGYLLLAVKDGKISDQTGIGMLGAGFVERKGDSTPLSILGTTALEAMSETNYIKSGVIDPKDKESKVEIPFEMDNSKTLGAVFGSNRDTTIAVHVPLQVNSDQVRLGHNLRNGAFVCEHQLGILVPNDLDTIAKILNEGAIEIPKSALSGEVAAGTKEEESVKLKLVDQALGVLYLYKLHRESGAIKSEAQASGEIKFVTKDESL